jgi:hypothetical protein
VGCLSVANESVACRKNCGSNNEKLHIPFITMAGEKPKTIPNSIKFLFGGLAG